MMRFVAALTLCTLVGLSTPAGAIPHRAVPAQRVPEPVVGSGRLVKQVRAPAEHPRSPGKDAGTREAPRARVQSGVPALLARGKAAPGKAPAIEMEHITSHATLDLRPDLRGGGFSARFMKSLSWFMRCHYTNKHKTMDQHLISLLYATARHFHNAKITVISGYRSPEVALAKGNPKSPHKRGVACDFRLAGVELTTLRDYLRGAYKGVGVGYYPNSGFVHLDVGRQQNAFWIDYSHPGERARYAADPESDLQSGVAERGGPLPPPAAAAAAAEPLPQAPAALQDEDPAPAGDDGGH